VGGDRHAQAAVSRGKDPRVQLDEYGEKNTLLQPSQFETWTVKSVANLAGS